MSTDTLTEAQLLASIDGILADAETRVREEPGVRMTLTGWRSRWQRQGTFVHPGRMREVINALVARGEMMRVDGVTKRGRHWYAAELFELVTAKKRGR